MNTTEKGEAKKKGTIQVKTDLRQLLKLAEQESTVIWTANQMGLITVLDQLAEAGRKTSDDKLRSLLDNLCLVDNVNPITATNLD